MQEEEQIYMSKTTEILFCKFCYKHTKISDHISWKLKLQQFNAAQRNNPHLT